MTATEHATELRTSLGTLVPALYRVREFQEASPTADRCLALAVLEDALHVVLEPQAPGRRRMQADTERWLQSDAADWPFAFREVCRTLALDPLWLRAQVLARRTPMHRIRSAA